MRRKHVSRRCASLLLSQSPLCLGAQRVLTVRDGGGLLLDAASGPSLLMNC